MNKIYGIAYNEMNITIVVCSERYNNLEKVYEEFQKIEQKAGETYEKQAKFAGIINDEMTWTCVSVVENPDKLKNDINSIKMENSETDETCENHGKFCDIRSKIFAKYYNEMNE